MMNERPRISPLLCGWLIAGLLLLAAAGCAQPEAGSPQAEPAAPVQVLIVGGGQHHDFDRWFDAADSTTLAAVGAEVRYTDEPEEVLPALSEVDVLYLANNQPLPDAGLRDSIVAFAEAGKGLIIGHAAVWYNWADWPAFNRDLVGGGARGHRAYGAFEVAVADSTHPVMQGVPPTFTIRDELYRREHGPEAAAIHVLATAEEPETGEVHPVIWTVQHPDARIVVNTLGHDGAAHNHPAYRQILQNSLRWTSRQ